MEEVRWQKDPLPSLVNTEAEQALLGAIFRDNRAFEHVADIVRPDDFGFSVHGSIFAAIERAVSCGRLANPVTLKPEIASLDSLPSNYLMQLAHSAVTIANVRDFAARIADMSKRRQIVSAAQEIIVDAGVPDIERSADIVLDEAEQRLFEIGENKSGEGPRRLGEVIPATIGAIEAAYKAGGAVCVDTGLLDLDRIISGMGAGELCVIAGRPGMGKSMLAGTIALNVAQRGKASLLFSLEMTRAELTQRWLAGMTAIDTDRQRQGQLDPRDWDRLVKAGAELDALPIFIDDQGRLSVAQMRQRARRLRRRHGLDLLIIDHVQLIRQGGRQESRRLEIGDATSALKTVAKELGVPVLVLSQLSRACEQRDNKRPLLSDLRESGDIEQDADVVMLLYRDEYYLARSEPKRRQGQSVDSFSAALADWQQHCEEVRGIAEIEVAKNRHGRTGLAKVMFDGERQRFDNLARGW